MKKRKGDSEIIGAADTVRNVRKTTVRPILEEKLSDEDEARRQLAVEKVVEGEEAIGIVDVPIFCGHNPSKSIGRFEKLSSGRYRFRREKVVEGEVLDSNLEDTVGSAKGLPAPNER